MHFQFTREALGQQLAETTCCFRLCCNQVISRLAGPAHVRGAALRQHLAGRQNVERGRASLQVAPFEGLRCKQDLAPKIITEPLREDESSTGSRV